MTSMPASRKARAITLTPRSCPSSPGFASKTLILWSLIIVPAPNQNRRSKHRLAIFAKYRAQGIAHLAERRVGARAFYQQRHGVAPIGGPADQAGEGRPDPPAVALAPNLIKPLPLKLGD